MFKTEKELMAELLESIFSGNIDSGSKDDEKDEENKDAEESKGEGESDESSDDKPDEESDNESDNKSDESDESDKEGDEESDEEDEESDEEDEESDVEDTGDSSSGPFTSKIRSLQKQYNDLLIDAFERYAPECIEDALSETKSAFGENIEDILTAALDMLKTKILKDLGIESKGDETMPATAMGGFDPTVGKNMPMEISIGNDE